MSEPGTHGPGGGPAPVDAARSFEAAPNTDAARRRVYGRPAPSVAV